jgi:hypothetical protein
VEKKKILISFSLTSPLIKLLISCSFLVYIDEQPALAKEELEKNFAQIDAEAYSGND